MFFKLCAEDEFAKTYDKIPSYYTWNQVGKKFNRRKQGIVVEGYPGVKKTDALSRVYTIHPNNAECFHLRMLLHIVKGPTSCQITDPLMLWQNYRESLADDILHWKRQELSSNDIIFDQSIFDEALFELNKEVEVLLGKSIVHFGFAIHSYTYKIYIHVL